MVDYTAILSRRFSDSEWTLNGDDYSGLTWLSETSKPTKASLDSLWPKVQTEIEAEVEAKAATKAALLERLGITAEEAKLLLA
jgi:hypothetical protein